MTTKTPKTPRKKKSASTTEASDGVERAAVHTAPDSPELAARKEPPVSPERTLAQSRLALKRKVRMFYDLQRLRLQAAGRTLARPHKPGTNEKAEIFLHEDDVAILNGRALDLKRVEKEGLKDVEVHLKTFAFYRDVLSDKEIYKGIGPTMAGVIMAEFDIHRADTVSKMWKFSGLTSTKCKRCRKCFNVVEPSPDLEELMDGVEKLRQEAVAIATEARAELAKAEESWTTLNGEVRKARDVASIEIAKKMAKEAEERAATARIALEHAIGVAKKRSEQADAAEVEAKSLYHKGKVPKECTDPINPEDAVESGVAPRPTKGQKLPYNAFLRVKLVGVLGPVLIKLDSPWRKVYDDYKARLESKGWGKNKGHRHQAAIRYMIKMLLLDIHKRWRTHEGLFVRPPYSEEKLGMLPHSAAPLPAKHEEKVERDEEQDPLVDAMIEEEAQLAG